MRIDARPGKVRLGRLWIAVGVMALLLPIATKCAHAQEHPTEEQVKAAYLYNFGKFIRWQTPGISETFDICVLGKDPFHGVLTSTVAGEHIDGKSIVARDVTAVPESSRCQIVFISTSEETKLKSLLAIARRTNTLTVSDMPEFAERGGMIGLVNVAGKIRFEVNVAAVNDAGINVSSELLKVAVKVIGTNSTKEPGR